MRHRTKTLGARWTITAFTEYLLDSSCSTCFLFFDLDDSEWENTIMFLFSFCELNYSNLDFVIKSYMDFAFVMGMRNVKIQIRAEQFFTWDFKSVAKRRSAQFILRKNMLTTKCSNYRETIIIIFLFTNVQPNNVRFRFHQEWVWM